jgi:hypothetical protein
VISGPVSDIPRRPRFSYLLGLGGSAGPVDGALYGAKGIRQAARVRISNRSNGARVAFPLVLVEREAGVGLGLRLPVGDLGLRAAGVHTHSDTAFGTDRDMPIAMYLRGIRAETNAQLRRLPLRPALQLRGGMYRWGVRGYDTDGATRFGRLDTNNVSLISGEASIVPGWGGRVGLFAEYGHTSNSVFGQIDFFFVTSMTFFRQEKYRLDSLDLLYRMAGAFARKRFSVGRRHAFDIDIACSHLLARGFLHTRKYQTKFLLPTLPHKRTTHDLFDHDLMVLVPRVGYALSVGPVRAKLGVRQLIPFDRTGDGGGGKESKAAANITRRFRGGTSYRLGIDYLFGKGTPPPGPVLGH